MASQYFWNLVSEKRTFLYHAVWYSVVTATRWLSGRVSVSCAGGRGFKSRPDQYSGSENSWERSAAFAITPANDQTFTSSRTRTLNRRPHLSILQILTSEGMQKNHWGRNKSLAVTTLSVCSPRAHSNWRKLLWWPGWKANWEAK